MSGVPLALGATAAAAFAVTMARRRRGSAAVRAPKKPMLDALKKVRSTYRLNDVLIDSAGTIYLVAKPAQLERLVKQGSIWSHMRLLDSSGMHRGTQRSYAENANHWDGVESVVGAMLNGGSDDWKYYTVIPLPIPGWPRRQVWSVAKGRMVRPETMRKTPFDLCAGKPVEFGRSSGPVLLQLGEKYQTGCDWCVGPQIKPGWRYEHPPLFLAHGVALGDLRNIVKCGGLRWPSWALSWRVSPSYGDLVFLGDVRVAEMLARGGKRKHLYLAGTDIWSPAGRELDQLQRAVNLERDGNLTWWSGDIERSKGGWGQRGPQNDLLASTLDKATWDNIVGAMSYFGGNEDLTDPIGDRKRFVELLDGIIESHVVDGDPYVYPPRPEWDTPSKNRYPYMELKVLGRVGLESLPAVVYPVRARKRVFAALDQLGFQGARIPYRWGGPWAKKSKHDDALRRRWAATVTKAILRWANESRDTTEVWGAPSAWISGGRRR